MSATIKKVVGLQEIAISTPHSDSPEFPLLHFHLFVLHSPVVVRASPAHRKLCGGSTHNIHRFAFPSIPVFSPLA